MNKIIIKIEYSPSLDEYSLYEPSTDTIINSKTITEGLVLLNEFLISSNLINTDILKSVNIDYQIDSYTLKSMVDSNIKLLKRLNKGPTALQQAQDRFGSSPMSANLKKFSNSSSTPIVNNIKGSINQVRDDLKKSSYKRTSSSGFSSFGSKFGSKFKNTKLK